MFIKIRKNNPFLFYVNSYPRSGNTWLRGMLDNIMQPKKHDENPVFIKIFGRINLSYKPLNIKKNSNTSHVMIKSHGMMTKITHKNVPIVYIVRDGRDAACSYYNFNVQHRGYDESFDSFFERFVINEKAKDYREKVLMRFMGNWGDNVMSYVNNENVLIVTYENMKKDTMNEVKRILSFLCIDVDDVSIEKSIVKAMADLANKNRKHNYERGQIFGWKNKLTEKQNAQFIEKYGKVLTKIGYIL